MRDVTKENITATFLDYFGAETDPRLREIMESLANHLHNFALDTKLTHQEWQVGLDILRRAGQITTPERDEFVLLSDVLGLSSLVDMINSSEKGTNSSVLGPFHISNAPPMEMGSDLRGATEGELVLVEGSVTDPSGNPIAGATLDIWQTAPNGLYSSQDPDQDMYNFHALFTTGVDGRYGFTTVRPVSYTVPTDGPVGDLLKSTGRHPWRPSHLHYIIKAEGYKTLVTEVFPDDDPYLDQDTVFGVREDLVMSYKPQKAASFPGSGYALSGKVDEDFSRVDFDLILCAE
ncbi:MAG: hydroxyquinol 1,2-dioxygenase [Gammaproteobacteria bacterium]|nr:hydroxyquinol 1,2-dioxygenase [Gammaproteobacteria bacterium]